MATKTSLEERVDKDPYPVEQVRKLILRLNRNIYQNGMYLGPSLVYLLQESPLMPLLLAPESEDILKRRSDEIESLYRRFIFPKIPQLVATITSGSATFPGFGGGKYRMRVRAFREVRAKGRAAYKGQFPLDPGTRAALFDKNPLPPNDYVEVGFDNHSYIFCLRVKQSPSRKNKYRQLWEKLSPEEERQAIELVADVSQDPYDYWSENSQEFYRECYGKKATDLMINDCVGFKIIDLNQERAEQTIERLANRQHNLHIPGFNNIAVEYNNHLHRAKKVRPYSIDNTFVDTTFSNFPIEVKFADLRSMILEYCGPHNTWAYEQNGKKSNPFYDN